MKVTIAIDSFKGSLTSLEAGRTIGKGIKKIYQDAKISVRPLADGGEGTVEALTAGMGGSFCRVQVTGPLGRKADCTYGIVEKEKLAILEISGAAGITLVPPGRKDPWETTTYGVGEVIRDAVEKGCRKFVIGLGGSATNDGGIGMLQALGYGILDSEGKQVPFGAKGLGLIDRITSDQALPRLKECTFRIACDVTNPLCGDQGCSAVFGPQKGATPAMIRKMDSALAHFAEKVKAVNPQADPDRPGTGAAGGLGFAFLTFMNAALESGVKTVLEETRLESYVRESDLVVTGEGRLDGQTVMGKAPIGVARLAKKYGKPVIAFSGSVAKDAGECNAGGIDAYFPVLRTVTTLEEAMEPEQARENLENTTEQVFRLIRCMAEYKDSKWN